MTYSPYTNGDSLTLKPLASFDTILLMLIVHTMHSPIYRCNIRSQLLWKPWFIGLVLYCAGIPNTLNVVSNFPFLVIGIVGLVLTLQGNYFGLR
jgi:hypothetical protein